MAKRAEWVDMAKAIDDCRCTWSCHSSLGSGPQDEYAIFSDLLVAYAAILYNWGLFLKAADKNVGWLPGFL
nr:hypothetical protein [Secundilactobacillus paracollinoides]